MKKALLIGINYIGGKAPLKGCINDAHNVANFLVNNYGYLPENIRILTDDPSINSQGAPPPCVSEKKEKKSSKKDDKKAKKDKKEKGEKKDKKGKKKEDKRNLEEDEALYLQATRGVNEAERGSTYQRGLATKHDILEGAHWLVEGVQEGDHLFFHYSGHGTQVKDASGDEQDGMDEALCPMDYTQNGLIVDDDLSLILVKNLPHGVQLTAILDCCHSGSGLDLPFFYLAKDGAETKLSKKTKEKKKKKKEDKGAKKAKSDRGFVVMLSGCKDEQVSADVVLEGKATGAVSYSFVTSLQARNFQLSYADLLSNMKSVIAANVRSIIQCPMLSSNIDQFDFSQQFVA